MAKNSKGNLLVTFIILFSLSITIFSFLFLTGTRLKESGVRVSETESFYVAEGGLNKAIWYLATPVALGGKGLSWRAASSWEAFGRGGYYLTVTDSVVTGEVQIISTGEVAGTRKTVSEIVKVEGFPEAFKYAVYCNTGTDFSGNVVVKGDVYVNVNTTFGDNCSITDGYVYHPAGTTLSGHGTWTDGGAPNPLPGFPTFDPSYYDNLITAAHSVPAGNQTYSNTTVNLGGSTIYVNGDILISSNTTFNGPGTIVATGKISQSGNTYSSSSIKFISYGKVNVTGNTYTSGATYYSATEISASGNTRVNVGSFLTKGLVSLSGNLDFSGLIYAKTGAQPSSFSGNPVVRGSFVANSFTTFTGNASVYYDESKFPSDLPAGFTASSLSVKKGSWKGS